MRYHIEVSYHHLDQSRERLGIYPVFVEQLADANLWEQIKHQAKLAACRQHPRLATLKGGYWEMHRKP